MAMRSASSTYTDEVRSVERESGEEQREKEEKEEGEIIHTHFERVNCHR